MARDANPPDKLDYETNGVRFKIWTRGPYGHAECRGCRWEHVTNAASDSNDALADAEQLAAEHSASCPKRPTLPAAGQ